jgi:hypothetical protein
MARLRSTADDARVHDFLRGTDGLPVGLVHPGDVFDVDDDLVDDDGVDRVPAGVERVSDDTPLTVRETVTDTGGSDQPRRAARKPRSTKE